VRVRRIQTGHLRSDPDGGLVDEDERVNHRVRDVPRRQGFEDALAHYRADVGVFDEGDSRFAVAISVAMACSS
jgi:hypothetical protein